MFFTRRRLLQAAGIGTLNYVVRDSQQALAARVFVDRPVDGEHLIDFVHRMRGGWDESLYLQLLGAANEFKEGDEILGVAAVDELSRQRARDLLRRTPIDLIDTHQPHRDRLAAVIKPKSDNRPLSDRRIVTLQHLIDFLLSAQEPDIHAVKACLSSDTIACVAKLLSQSELSALSANLFNPLPGSRIGARGYLGARIQPNSPTDNVDDIRWQVFNGFAYAVGDVLLGTNPVSSNPEAVLAIELALRDILLTFGIQDLMPHCVLAHIDTQAEVEQRTPAATALWFQSIAGTDEANATFDVTVEKLVEYARQRRGPYGLYFETGQGADFTNGQAAGCDMVLLESRKYGLARALSRTVAETRNTETAWVHVNDVAGFIGPEVFRTREQLVRCCLEDLVMGKLHGLTIGLDVCSTLHMDVTLGDLDWCLEEIAPAQPAYLMALPTKIDPMLGYLTTGFQDHVRLREKFGARVNDGMWKFFQSLGVINTQGQPTEHFGDPVWVYREYRRRKGDQRSDSLVAAEARQQIGEVRKRGVFITTGFGQQPSELAPQLAREIQHIYDDAKVSIWREWDEAFIARIPHAVRLQTLAQDRQDYILHPSSGEQLSADSLNVLSSLRASQNAQVQVQLVISEGLNALALMDEGNLLPLLETVRAETARAGLRLAEENLVINSGRVRAGYRIGESLFGGLPGQRTIVHIIGERPGSGHHTMSVYITRAAGDKWEQKNQVDHNITTVISGIATTALQPEQAAGELRRLLSSQPI